MALTRIKPANWAVNEQLTSAQINALDSNAAGGLDKSAAGDTINGPIVFGGGGAGQITANLTATVRGGIAGGISSRVAAGIQSDAVNGINLNGGANDNVTFPARTKSYKVPMLPPYAASGWSLVAATAVTTAVLGGGQPFMLPSMINGATLATVKTWLIVNNVHASVPGALPSIIVFRRALPGAATADALVPLTVAPVAFPTPATGAIWTASGNVQNWTYTCTQNNVIDTSQYIYYVVAIDESGVNSIAGNIYCGFELGFTNITSYQVSVG